MTVMGCAGQEQGSSLEGGKAMAVTAQNNSSRRGKSWRIAAWTLAGCVMLLPLVAMQFTDEVKWTGFDFVFAGALIGGTGLVFELVARSTANVACRAAVGLALAAAFLLVWISGAVGIIGDEDNPANLMFGGVLLVAIVGALIARFRPQGMARAMAVTALGQALVAPIELAGRWGAAAPIWPWEVLGLTGFFTAMWLMSAGLFRLAARQQAPVRAATPG
jgi:hypothetical protein